MPKKSKQDKQSYADAQTWIAARPTKERRGLKSALTSLKKTFNSNAKRDLLWWYGVGSLVAKFFPDDSRQYGTGLMELLAQEVVLDPNDKSAVTAAANLLWQARSIAKVLGTEEEGEAWAAKTNRKGRPLSAYHIFALAKLERDTQRELLNRCLDESWSVQRLRLEVQNVFGHKRSRGGRKANPRITPSPVVALQDIQEAAKRWLADHDLWFVCEHAALKRVRNSERNSYFLEERKKAITELRKLRKAVEAELVRLESLAR